MFPQRAQPTANSGNPLSPKGLDQFPAKRRLAEAVSQPILGGRLHGVTVAVSVGCIRETGQVGLGGGSGVARIADPRGHVPPTGPAYRE